MEEVVTIDGKQIKLFYDTPLTTEQRAQAIADIRKAGCGTCGQKTMNTNPQIKSMAACAATGKTGGDTVNLLLTAVSGVAPYTTTFFKDLGPGRVAITPAGSTGTIAADGGTDGGTYTITDADAKNANFGGLAQIQFIGKITDSCPTGPLSCEQVCEVSITCVTPTCNFTVT